MHAERYAAMRGHEGDPMGSASPRSHYITVSDSSDNEWPSPGHTHGQDSDRLLSSVRAGPSARDDSVVDDARRHGTGCEPEDAERSWRRVAVPAGSWSSQEAERSWRRGAAPAGSAPAGSWSSLEAERSWRRVAAPAGSWSSQVQGPTLEAVSLEDWQALAPPGVRGAPVGNEEAPDLNPKHRPVYPQPTPKLLMEPKDVDSGSPRGEDDAGAGGEGSAPPEGGGRNGLGGGLRSAVSLETPKRSSPEWEALREVQAAQTPSRRSGRLGDRKKSLSLRLPPKGGGGDGGSLPMTPPHRRSVEGSPSYRSADAAHRVFDRMATRKSVERIAAPRAPDRGDGGEWHAPPADESTAVADAHNGDGGIGGGEGGGADGGNLGGPDPAARSGGGGSGSQCGLEDRSWFIFGYENRIRLFCLMVMCHPWFDQLMLAVVLSNAISIVVEMEMDNKGDFFPILEYVYVALYSAEFILKTIALGFAIGPEVYLRDGWNWLDCIVLFSSYVQIALEVAGGSSDLGFVILLRMIRVLRVLRTVSLFPDLRVLVQTLFRAFPSMMRIATMFSLIMIVFGSLGLQLFSGVLRKHCALESMLPPNYEELDTRAELFRALDEMYPGGWENELDYISDRVVDCDKCEDGYVCVPLHNPYHDQQSFDDFGYAFVTLFVVVTGEGWAELMYSICNQTSWWATIFFVALVLSGTNLVINLLLAVIKESFSMSMTRNMKNKKAEAARAVIAAQERIMDRALGGSMILRRPSGSYSSSTGSRRLTSVTEAAGALVDYARVSAIRLRSRVRRAAAQQEGVFPVLLAGARRLQVMCETTTFVTLTMLATLMNTVILAVRHRGMSTDTQSFLDDLSRAMLVLFWIETGIKLLAYNVRFHENGFDMFDLVVNTISVVSIVVESKALGGSVTATRNIRIARVVRLVRTMRVLRVLKMVRYLRALRTAVKVLATQAKVVANVSLLLAIAMFMYAVLGMFLFKSDYEAALVDGPSAADLLQPRPSFTTFYWSLISMFQALTLEGWILLMYDGMRWRPAVSAVFFITWVVIGAYVLLSLMLSIILDKFERDFREHQMMEKRQRMKKREEAEAARTGKVLNKRLEGGAIKVEQIPFMLDALGAEPTDHNIELVRAHCNILPEDKVVSLDTLVAALPGGNIVSMEKSQDLRAVYSMWLIYDTDHSGELSVSEIQHMVDNVDSNRLGPEERMILIDGLCQGLGSGKSIVGRSSRSRSMYADVPVPFYMFLKALTMVMDAAVAAGGSKDIGTIFGKERVGWLREQFRKFDQDASGFIGAEELKLFIKSLGQDIDDWELQEIINEIDLDSSGEIGFSEFLRGFSHLIDEEKIRQLQIEDEAAKGSSLLMDLDTRQGTMQVLEAHTARAAMAAGKNKDMAAGGNVGPVAPPRSAGSGIPRLAGTNSWSEPRRSHGSISPNSSYKSQQRWTPPMSQAARAGPSGAGTKGAGTVRHSLSMSSSPVDRHQSMSRSASMPAPNEGSGQEEVSPVVAFLARQPSSRAQQRWQLAIALGNAEPLFVTTPTSSPGPGSTGSAPVVGFEVLRPSWSRQTSASTAATGGAVGGGRASADLSGHEGDGSQGSPSISIGSSANNRSLTVTPDVTPNSSLTRFANEDVHIVMPPSSLRGSRGTGTPDGSHRRVVIDVDGGLAALAEGREGGAHEGGGEGGGDMDGALSPAAREDLAQGSTRSRGGGDLPVMQEVLEHEDATPATSPPEPQRPLIRTNTMSTTGLSDWMDGDENGGGGEEAPFLAGNACCVLAPDSRIRQALFAVLTHKAFETSLLLLIIASSIMLASEDPTWESPPRWFVVVDLVFTGVFTLEVLTKLLVYGAFCPRGAYLRDGWNVLDAVVVVSSLVSIILDFTGFGSKLSFLRAIRMVRTLRPLRAISRRPQARRAFNTLMAAIPSFLSVSLIVMFIVLVFAIIALDLFAGTFFRCRSGGMFVEPALGPGGVELTRRECDALDGHRFVLDGWFCWDTRGAFSADANTTLGHTAWVPLATEDDLNTEEECTAANFRWVDSIINFNHLGNACFTLFVVITGEGWVEIMLQTVDIGSAAEVPGVAVPPNRTLDPGSNASNAIYFVIFITFVSFFLFDMFGGAVYTFYMESKAKEEGLHVLTEAQRKFKDTQDEMRRIVDDVKPPRTKTAVQRVAHGIVESTRFNIVITVLVILQVLLMFAHHEDEPAELALVLACYDVFMAVALMAELALKWVAEGSKELFASRWNRFDMTILLISLIDIVLTVMAYVSSDDDNSPTGGIATLRLLRLGRFFRSLVRGPQKGRLSDISRAVHKLQVVLETFLESFNSLLDIGILLIVFYFIFGVVGMNLFGSLGSPGEALSGDANFLNIFKAVITLFRISTGEDWQLLYEDIVYFKCNPQTRLWRPEECPTAAPAVFFWLFYMLMVTMIINLFIAIIIENFSTVVNREYSAMGMDHVRSWIEDWKKMGAQFEPGGQCYIGVKQFVRFLEYYPEPLGCARGMQQPVDMEAEYTPSARVLQRIKELELGVVDGKVYLSDSLEKAVRRVGRMTNPGLGGKKGDSLLGSSYLNLFVKALKQGTKENAERRSQGEEQVQQVADPSGTKGREGEEGPTSRRNSSAGSVRSPRSNHGDEGDLA